MKKIVLIVSTAILCFGIINQSWADDLTTLSYENCPNCLYCGTYCKYSKDAENNYVIYGPTQEDENGQIPEGILSTNALFDKDMNSLKFEGNIVDTGTAALQYIDFPNPYTSRHDIVLPDSLKTIGESTFFGVYGVNIVIPDSVTDIKANAFMSSYNTIYCPDTKKELCESSIPSPWFPSSALASVLKIYESQNGVYIITDGDNKNYYSSAESMAAANGAVEEGCETKASCQSKVLQNMKDKDLCTTDANCLKLFEIMADTDIICRTGAKNTVLTCSTYAKDMGIIPTFIEDYQPDGSIIIKNKQGDILGYKNKRSYTPAEAETVSGDTNTITLIYK